MTVPECWVPLMLLVDAERLGCRGEALLALPCATQPPSLAGSSCTRVPFPRSHRREEPKGRRVGMRVVWAPAGVSPGEPGPGE